MLQLGQCAPALPGFTPPKTYAAWPVWSGSTTAKVRFAPVGRKDAARIYHRAREFERKTRQPGRQDGALGRNGLKVLEALLFDFLNYATGQLDPAYSAIAEAAGMCERSVARGLQALKAAGVLFWQRRCSERRAEDGSFLMEQDSNAYAVLPVSQWRGYTGQAEAPAPEPGTWGDHPCGTRDALTEAVSEGPAASVMSLVQQLENDPTDELAAVLARLGRRIEEAKTPAITEPVSLTEKHALRLIL
jgi:hypothetical protein